MQIAEALNYLADKGIRVEVAFDDKTILRFMAYGVVAGIVSGIVLALVKKTIAK